MATLNKKTRKNSSKIETRLAGGLGPRAAKNSDEQTLRRLVMSCLLWEDAAYIDGASIAEEIKKMVHKVDANDVAAIAVEARYVQKLRHVPLLLARELARKDLGRVHKHIVSDTIYQVINRPDELCEFVALYWSDNGGKKSLSSQVKKGLARAFTKFDEYQLAKWNRKDKAVTLRDVLFLCHAKPLDKAGEKLFKKLIDDKLQTPDTWEVGYSAAKTNEDKREVWESLIKDKKLGALAFLRNLRNMIDVGVPKPVIRQGLKELPTAMLLPLDFFKAVKVAPDFQTDLENLMFRCLGQYPKLSGETVIVLDVSGSMASLLSSHSEYSRMDAGTALVILAMEMCEHPTIYLTAGNDITSVHKTVKVPNNRGFGFIDTVDSKLIELGGGGIFTRQCLEYIKDQETDVDRIIVISDSQDCDRIDKTPKPFGKTNYIVDVSCHMHGVNYRGAWTSEITGWSEHFLRYIAELEKGCLN